MKQRYRILTVVTLFVLAGLTAFAQTKTISGTIKDTQGRGMPGVNVIVKGTSTGTTSDADGKYNLSVNDAANTLVFSFIGFATQEVEIGGRTVVDVSLSEDVTELSEVVVTALGIERNTKALQYSVTKVSGENFTQARENNLANALTGRIAGVNVTKLATGPGGSSRVVIRGAKSLNNTNQPLYVVDGIPMDYRQYGNAGVWGGSDQGDALTSINPDDIESITVLKGANAAALYGSRGAYGVINITTKKGSGRKGLGIEFNSNYVMETINNLTDFQKDYGSGGYVGATLDTQVATKPSTQAQAFSGWGASGWGPKMDGSSTIQFDGVSRPYSYAGDNWKRFFETGTAFTNSLALNGGSDTQNFRFGVSNMKSKSVIPNSGFDRMNLSLATNSKFGKNLTLVSKVMFSHEETKNRPFLSDSPGNGILSMYYIPNNVNVLDYKGDPNKLGAVPVGTTTPDNKSAGEEYSQTDNIYSQNPYWAAYQYVTSDKRDRLIGSAQLRYNFTDWLYLQGKLGFDGNVRKDQSITPQGTSHNRGGTMTEGITRTGELNLEYILGFDKAFSKINVNAFIGGNRMRTQYERISASGSGFNVPFFHAINNVLGTSRNFGYGFNQTGINSLFGSAEISYNNYLFLTGTARQDWFSVLNPEQNHQFYPSVGASFVFSDAISTLPTWLSFGKARLSWARVAGASINPYSTNLNYSLTGSHVGAPIASFSSATGNGGNLPNPLLHPFLSSEIEGGFDLRFMDNRLGLDVTYYSQTTTDDILNAGISRASGFATTSVNLGKMTNKGIEVLVTGTPVKKGALTWEVSLNFAKNMNKVVSLIAGNTTLNIEEPRTRTVFVSHMEGHPFGMITGLKQRVSPDGQLVYDAFGTPLTDNKYYILGNGVPKFTGGLNNVITYKGINLTFLIDFKSGGDIYSGTNVRMTGSGFHKQTLQGRDGEKPLTVSGVIQNGTDASGNPIYEPFTKTLTPGEARNYWGQLANRAQENFIYDASFVKLRQITLGYSIPKQLLNKTPISNLTVSFVGRNLAILFKNVPNIDPESSYTSSNAQGLDYFGMPSTRTYGFNLRATF